MYYGTKEPTKESCGWYIGDLHSRGIDDSLDISLTIDEDDVKVATYIIPDFGSGAANCLM